MYPINTISKNLLEQDYDYGVLNILWFVENGIRNIIFAYIELLPNEYPEPFNTEEDHFLADNKLKQRLYFIRVKGKAKDLIDWYIKASKNEKLPMFWNNKKDKVGNLVNFEAISYAQEPIYPKMILSNNLPFLGDHSGCSRCNFLFERNLPEEIKDICRKDAVLEWINNKLKFDLSQYPEYIGCISLVAYNPLIRSIHSKLIRDDKTNFESVSYHVEPRTNVDISNLTFLHLEQRNLGFSSMKEVQLKKQNFILKNIGDIEQTGYAIFCPNRGLLMWEGFHSFMKSLVLNLNMVTGTNIIEVPNKKLNEVEETYENQRYSNETVTVGQEDKQNKAETLSIRLYKAKYNRKKNNISKNNQKLFYEKPKEATFFLRDIISKAKKRLIIIDPYITTRELFKFALSVNPSVNVIIVTSSLVLKNKEIKHANILLKNIENIAKNVKIDAYVMKGKNPAFHDRFIIIDDQVWLSGNSLADIGKRASILVQLEDPKPILKIYYEVISDIQKADALNYWVKNHEKTKLGN